MSGGKGGSTSSAVEIPEWMNTAAQQNVGRAQQAQQIGYTPYYGPDIAAFSPAQQAAQQSTMDTASAFGLAPQGMSASAGMPQAQEYAGGIQGYSAAPLYTQALNEFQTQRPGQYDAINAMFADPQTGAPPANFAPATIVGTDPITGQPMYSSNNSYMGDDNPYDNPPAEENFGSIFDAPMFNDTRAQAVFGIQPTQQERVAEQQQRALQAGIAANGDNNAAFNSSPSAGYDY
tara:strand:+ start:553 stop:1251 length:699 start_codon:yes stop_codon:yes gene_type:complete